MKGEQSEDDIPRITALGMCSGCGACLHCGHLHLERSSLGFDIPVPDEGCTHCGKCVKACIFDPEWEND